MTPTADELMEEEKCPHGYYFAEVHCQICCTKVIAALKAENEKFRKALEQVNTDHEGLSGDCITDHYSDRDCDCWRKIVVAALAEEGKE